MWIYSTFGKEILPETIGVKSNVSYTELGSREIVFDTIHKIDNTTRSIEMVFGMDRGSVLVVGWVGGYR